MNFVCPEDQVHSKVSNPSSSASLKNTGASYEAGRGEQTDVVRRTIHLFQRRLRTQSG